MAKQTVNNGDSGLSARNKINSNFTELYNFGYQRCNSFTSTVGSNSVTLTTAVANADYEVIFFSPDGVGCGAATSKATTGFSVQCNAIGTVIYILMEKN